MRSMTLTKLRSHNLVPACYTARHTAHPFNCPTNMGLGRRVVTQGLGYRALSGPGPLRPDQVEGRERN